ncbi:MAG TPA: hypothetical protein VEL73_08285 [Mycobacteriales bacterium]|nr:hypothetical protein [Mycobacteriales bacterium]
MGGERVDRLRRRREIYERIALGGERRGVLRRWRVRRNLRRLVSAPPYGPSGGWRDEGGESGGAGVREPRRPLPKSPEGAAEIPRD